MPPSPRVGVGVGVNVPATAATARSTAAVVVVLLSALILLVASVPPLILHFAADLGPASPDPVHPGGRPFVWSGKASAEARDRTSPPDTHPAAPRWNWTSSSLAGGGEGLGRFPVRDTAFERECGWTLRAPGSRVGRGGDNCTVLVRPKPGSSEGVAEWLSHAVAWYTLTLQSGCRLLVDYGENGVDVARVVEPPLNTDGTAEAGIYDWRVPPRFLCLESGGCIRSTLDLARPSRYHGSWLRSPALLKLTNRTANWVAAADVPAYRFSATRKLLHRGDPALAPLIRALPNYHLESGYACSQANLFRLSASAAEYEPRLFAEILPAMRDPRRLVLGMYVRSGSVERSDGRTNLKREELYEKARTEGGGRNYTAMAGRAIECALRLEEEYLSGEYNGGGEGGFSSVVWAFFSDAPDLKSWVLRTYSDKPTTSSGPVAPRRRRVLITSTSSNHTRLSQRSPPQAAFAGAIIDWHLLGEANVVIVDRGDTITSTFGTTAAMRTGRPVYDATRNKVGGCIRRNMVWPAEKGKKKKRRGTKQ